MKTNKTTPEEEFSERYFRREEAKDFLLISALTLCILVVIVFGTIYGEQIDQLLESLAKRSCPW